MIARCRQGRLAGFEGLGALSNGELRESFIHHPSRSRRLMRRRRAELDCARSTKVLAAVRRDASDDWRTDDRRAIRGEIAAELKANRTAVTEKTRLAEAITFLEVADR